MTTRLVLGAALVLMLLTGVPWLLHGDQDAAIPIVAEQALLLPVEAAPLQPAVSYREEMRYTGLVEADQVGSLGFEKSGKLESILVDEGDRIQKGQPLAVLDRARLNLEKQALQAQMEQAVAILQELTVGPRAERILAQEATVRELQAGRIQTEQEAKRQASLLTGGVSSQEHADAYRSQADVALARLEAAEHRLAEMTTGTRPEQIQAQKASVTILRAKLQMVDLDLERAVLKAPYSGTVTHRLVDQGVVLDAGTPLLQIQSDSFMKAKIGVPDSLADDLLVGSSQNIRIGDEFIPATLSALLPQVDRHTRSRTMVLEIPQGATIPGRTVEWLFGRERLVEGYWVPSTALLPGRRGLWAVLLLESENDGSFRVLKQEVQVIHTEATRVLLRADTLRTNDQVITSGTERVVPGQTVRISQKGKQADS